MILVGVRGTWQCRYAVNRLQGKREQDDIAQNGLLPDKGLSITILLETSSLQLHMLREKWDRVVFIPFLSNAQKLLQTTSSFHVLRSFTFL